MLSIYYRNMAAIIEVESIILFLFDTVDKPDL